jgi:AhpD family alkylhydroperoxidase
MAVAVALTTQCPYCIAVHAEKAKKAGATEQELAEATLVAAARSPTARSRWNDGGPRDLR